MPNTHLRLNYTVRSFGATMGTATQSHEALTVTRGRNYRSLQYAAAVLLAVFTLLYSAAWMYYVRRPLQATQVEIGIRRILLLRRS